MHGNLVHAPLQRPKMILDVGCGTGITTRYLGYLYPSASVIYGIDISPIPAFESSSSSTPPSNVSYIEGDIHNLEHTDPRLRPTSFDYIFQRLLIGGMTDWATHVRAMAGLLKPGAWFEVHDHAQVWFRHEDEVCSAEWAWLKKMRQGARGLGLDLDCGFNAQTYMRQAGLVDVEVTRYQIPAGTWMAAEKPEKRRIGEHMAREMGPLFSGQMLPGMTRCLGLSKRVIGELQDECERCLEGEDGKFCWFYVTIGRKAGETAGNIVVGESERGKV